MPVTINDVEVMDSSGKFTENFKPEMLGEAYKDSQFFKTTPDLMSLAKAAADTKSALGKKMEGVIQKPDENATDEQKADYRKSLQRELGAPEKADDYEFPRAELTLDDDVKEFFGRVFPETPITELPYNEESEKFFRELFMKEGVPAETVKNIVTAYNRFQVQQYNIGLKEKMQKFQEDAKSLKDDWKGDNLVKNCRTAYAFYKEFGTKELLNLLDSSKIYDNATDLEKWFTLGIDPGQLRIAANVGEKMKVAQPPTDEGTPKGTPGGEKKTGILGVYDHPTSRQMKVAKT